MRKELITLFAILLAVFLAIGCTSIYTEDQPEESVIEEEPMDAEEEIMHEEEPMDSEEEMMHEEEPMDSEAEVMHGEMNIIETADTAGSFNTLLIAVHEAGLAGTLSNEGPFTVFAPTDEAFAALPEDTLETLEDKETLTAVLTYHVVEGEVSSGDLYDMMALGTLNGEEVIITRNNGNLMVGDANVVQADIRSSNGVIHVIDKVILPPYMMETEMMGNQTEEESTEGGEVIPITVPDE